MSAAAHVRPMVAADWPVVRAIYQEGLATGHASFETEAPDAWATWAAGKLEVGRCVAEGADGVLGFAALAPVSARPVYAGVAEVSVYVAARARGRGLGRALLGRVVTDAETAGLWTLQSSVFPENEATLALHAALGFRTVGRRERIARHHGIWRDTLLLERRSVAVGRG